MRHMNKVRLFDDVPGETYTEKGNELSKDIGHVLRPIFEKAKRDNVCLRDLENIATGEVMIFTSEMILRWAIDDHRDQKKTKEFQETANYPTLKG